MNWKRFIMGFALLAIFAMPAEAVVSYTSSPAPFVYIDEGGTTLMDGVLAPTSDRWTNEANVGWMDNASVVITVDLGVNTTIGGVRGFFYSSGGTNNMWYPIEIEVSASTDGVNFSDPVSVFPVDTTPAGSNGFTWLGVEFTPAAEIARYVKMENFTNFAYGNGWIFLSEIEILEPTALQAFLANLQAQIDAIGQGPQGPPGPAGPPGALDDAQIESLEDQFNSHVHDKGSGSRNTSAPTAPLVIE